MLYLRAKQALGYLVLDKYLTLSTFLSDLPIIEPLSNTQSPLLDNSLVLSTY